MILKLDPRWPLVWRDPVTLQVGIDPPHTVLDSLTTLDEKLIAALSVGVPRNGLEVIANGQGAAVDALLERLREVLLDSSEAAPAHRIAVCGAGPLSSSVAEALHRLGHEVELAADAAVLDDRAPDLAILVGSWVLSPALHSFWLRRDIAHLPVVLTEEAVHVGPVVEPGSGPCLLCIELHRADEDPAWPAIATQLLGRGTAAVHPVLLAEATAAIARLATSRLSDGAGVARSVRLAAGGARSWREWEPHPDCGCRGFVDLDEVRARRGTDSADADSAPDLPLPRTAPSGAGRA